MRASSAVWAWWHMKRQEPPEECGEDACAEEGGGRKEKAVLGEVGLMVVAAMMVSRG